MALGRQQIIVAHNELLEFSQNVNQNEVFRVYFRDRTMDLSVNVAIKVAGIWITDILEMDLQLTNSYAIRIIEQVKNETKLEDTKFYSANKLKDNFPILKSVFNDLSKAVKECYVTIDTSLQYEYRYPILTYGRTMGYNHIGIIKKNETNYELYSFTVSENKTTRIDAESIFINEELSEEKYFLSYASMMREVQSNPLFIKISTNL